MPELEDGKTSIFIAPTRTGIKNHLNLREQKSGTPFQVILRALPSNTPLKLVLSQFCNIPIFFVCWFFFVFVFVHTVNAI